MPEDARITQKQETFLLALIAANGNISVATKTCKINESTGRRWLKLPEVQDALNQARKDAYSTSMHQLTGLVDAAIKLLKIALDDKKAGYGVRLRAAAMILEHAHMHVIDEELEARIATLEGLS